MTRPLPLGLLAALACAGALAGCGGDDDDADAPSADEVRSCLEGKGVDALASGGGSAGRKSTVTVVLRESNVINVGFYDTEENAEKGAEDARNGVEAVDAGGVVKRRGTVVYSSLRGSGGDELRKVEDCL